MSTEHEQGEKAAGNGQSAIACPYPTGRQRTQWLAGFFGKKIVRPNNRRRSRAELARV